MTDSKFPINRDVLNFIEKYDSLLVNKKISEKEYNAAFSLVLKKVYEKFVESKNIKKNWEVDGF